MGSKWVVGIDEAGRGPLAGPVAVAAVAATASVKRKTQNVKFRDSKKLSFKKREEIFKLVASSQKLVAVCSLVGEKIIDQHGIVYAVRLGIKRSLQKLNINPKMCNILLDGSLKAPPEYKNQKTVIRGDETVPIIALASIVAKVKRDRRMIRISKKYPQYNFHVHKGYGTRAHYRALRINGPSEIHRLTFLGERV